MEFAQMLNVDLGTFASLFSVTAILAPLLEETVFRGFFVDNTHQVHANLGSGAHQLIWIWCSTCLSKRSTTACCPRYPIRIQLRAIQKLADAHAYTLVHGMGQS